MLKIIKCLNQFTFPTTITKFAFASEIKRQRDNFSGPTTSSTTTSTNSSPTSSSTSTSTTSTSTTSTASSTSNSDTSDSDNLKRKKRKKSNTDLHHLNFIQNTNFKKKLKIEGEDFETRNNDIINILFKKHDTQFLNYKNFEIDSIRKIDKLELDNMQEELFIDFNSINYPPKDYIKSYDKFKAKSDKFIAQLHNFPRMRISNHNILDCFKYEEVCSEKNEINKIENLQELNSMLMFMSICQIFKFEEKFPKYNKIIDKYVEEKLNFPNLSIEEKYFILKMNILVQNNKLNENILNMLDECLGTPITEEMLLKSRHDTNSFIPLIVDNYVVFMEYFRQMNYKVQLKNYKIISNFRLSFEYVNEYVITSLTEFASCLDEMMHIINQLNKYKLEFVSITYDIFMKFFKRQKFANDIQKKLYTNYILISSNLLWFLCKFSHIRCKSEVNFILNKIINFLNETKFSHFLKKHISFYLTTLILLDSIYYKDSVDEKFYNTKLIFVEKLHHFYEKISLEELKNDLLINVLLRNFYLRDYSNNPAIINTVKTLEKKFIVDVEKEEIVTLYKYLYINGYNIFTIPDQKLIINRICTNINELKKLDFIELNRAIYLLTVDNFSKEFVFESIKSDYFQKLYYLTIVKTPYHFNVHHLLVNLLFFMPVISLIDERKIYKEKEKNYTKLQGVINKDHSQIIEDYQIFDRNYITKQDMLNILEKIFITLQAESSNIKYLNIPNFLNTLFYFCNLFNKSLIKKYYLAVSYKMFNYHLTTQSHNEQRQINETLRTLINTSYYVSNSGDPYAMFYHLKLIIKLVIFVLKKTILQEANKNYFLQNLNLFYNFYNMNAQGYENVEKTFPRCKFLKIILKTRNDFGFSAQNLIKKIDKIKKL